MDDILKFGKSVTKRVMGGGIGYMLSLVFLILSVDGFAQEPIDSTTVAKRVAAFATDKLAITRPLNVEFLGVSPYSFVSDEIGGGKSQHRVMDFKQAKISVNRNFFKR